MRDVQKLRELLERAYAAGFGASGEGWNGEYPFQDDGIDPVSDDNWVSMRDHQIAALISQAEGEGQHG